MDLKLWLDYLLPDSQTKNPHPNMTAVATMLEFENMRLGAA